MSIISIWFHSIASQVVSRSWAEELNGFKLQITMSGNNTSSDSWYVAFRNSRLPDGEYYVRNTRTFRTECEAKRFAADLLAEGCDVCAGTLNPHFPKRTIGLSQMVNWLGGN